MSARHTRRRAPRALDDFTKALVACLREKTDDSIAALLAAARKVDEESASLSPLARTNLAAAWPRERIERLLDGDEGEWNRLLAVFHEEAEGFEEIRALAPKAA